MKISDQEKNSLTTILLSRIILIAISIAATLFPTRTPSPGETLWTATTPIAGRFARWDAGWYLYIAEHGYTKKLLYAFRPIYPTILNISQRLINGDPLETTAATGFLWNLIALIAATIIIHRLTRHLYGEQTAQHTVTLLAIYPSTVFLTAQYPEATYLLLTASTFYLLETNRYTYAAITATLAGLTRPEALLLTIPLLLRYIYIDRNPKLLTGAVATALTMPAFMLFTYLNGDDPLYLITSQEEWNNIRILNIIQPHPPEQTIFLIIGAATMIIALTATLYEVTRRINIGESKTHYMIWAIMLLTVFILVGDIKSWTRYTLTIIPVHWSLAAITTKKNTVYVATIMTYTAIMVFGTIAYVNWYHFL